MATVCCKLFLQCEAQVAVFGEKDWQQLQVVTRMATDLDIPIRILPVATVREADGLAMSSRNRFLSPEDRATAPVLLRVMTKAAAAIASGGAVAEALGAGLETLRDHGFAPDYLALVEAETLKPLAARRQDGPMRLVAAARLGTVRLLDNIAV